MPDSRFTALLSPLEIKGVRIRNRIMSTAHTSGAGEDGKPKEKYQLYHEEKAKGGIGLTMIGGSTAIAEDTPGADMLHLDASSDAIVPYYAELAERVHRHGATVFAQLAHMGRRANWDNQHWLPPISPSRVREPAHRSFPKAMEEWDFARIRKAFASAAARVRRGGIDGVELSATHGHLIDQFWSPRVNQRTDRYGGSLPNRMRFVLEILEDVRREVGNDFVVGMRISGDELIEGGLAPEDCLSIAQILVEEGGVDYLSILGGQAENLPSHAVIFPNMSAPSATFLHLASTIRRQVRVPVFYTQKIADIVTAARAIADGHADMVGMTRAHLADPHIVRKLIEGRSEDIRPCVGANYCIDRLYSGGQAYCLHNAATGREQTIPHVIDRAARPRIAVVVGAGPAGLEAARVLAARGHRVTLIERDAESGGAVRIAARAGWRQNLLNITRWLEQQVRKARVDLRLGVEADASRILEFNPGLVVLATGGRPAKGPFIGHQYATTVADVLAGRVAPGKRVLIFDDSGREAALSCAEFCAEQGSTIEVVTADPHAGVLLERTTRPTFLRHLYGCGVAFTPDRRLKEVYEDAAGLIAVLQNEYTGDEEERIADQVIVDYGSEPDEALYAQLQSQSSNRGAWDYAALVRGDPQSVNADPTKAFQLFRIGDAVASRNIHAAIYDATRLCKDL
jgi:2,4-dienoyl-CoA reductase-like NADH-dependent reductase (Old Yellow Enzyme family)